MTTIVHHDGVLYADQCHIRAGRPISTYAATKLFVSGDKQFAYGVSGTCIRPDDRPGAEVILRQFIEEVMITKLGDIARLSEFANGDALNKAFIDGHALIITKQRAFSVTSVGYVDATGLTSGVGTGGFLVVGMIKGGLPPKEAFARLGDVDPFTTGQVDSVSMKSLKPFVIKGESK